MKFKVTNDTVLVFAVVFLLFSVIFTIGYANGR